MADAPAHVVEFAVFFRPEGEKAVQQSFIDDRATAASKVRGLVRQYAGPKMEDVGATVHVTVWSSLGARNAFESSRKGEEIPALIEVYNIDGEDPTQALAAFDAPVTEVYTGYAALPSVFAAATRLFRDKLDEGYGEKDAKGTSAQKEGYYASTVLETAEDVAPSPDAVRAVPKLSNWVGPAVKLIIGWESKEAHLQAKEKPGPLSENINILKDGRKEEDMYHVKFKVV